MIPTPVIVKRCEVCKRKLRGKQQLHCGDHCANKANRNLVKERVRYQRWYEANKEHRRAQVLSWRQAHRAETLEYMRIYRNAASCPFCDGTRYITAGACRDCSLRYGCNCSTNGDCGVVGVHKHCPCGMPVRRKNHQYHIEACGICLGEMQRLGVTLAQLFERVSEDDAAVESEQAVA